MTEKIKKHGVEISKEGQHIRITVPSFSTLIIVYPEDKKHFVRYLKYIYNKYKVNKSFYEHGSTIQYRESKIYLGNNFAIKHPKFGNYLEINKIPIIFSLLHCDGL